MKEGALRPSGLTPPSVRSRQPFSEVTPPEDLRAFVHSLRKYWLTFLCVLALFKFPWQTVNKPPSFLHGAYSKLIRKTSNEQIHYVSGGTRSVEKPSGGGVRQGSSGDSLFR